MAIYRGPGGSGDATTDATNQASVASDAAVAAANSATNAATSATSAESSASGATTSATNAANSATSASNSASTATTQAGIATTQASNAATSATNAATSAADAATTYDNFDDRYLGSKASAPSVDNDGNALLTGALYWNSTSNTMNVWTGSAWTGLGGSSGVSSFNTRTGAVTLSSSDVTTALTFTPPSTTGSGATGTWNIDVLGNAGTVTNGVYTIGNQTIGGIKTFSSTISGSINGNAATVTNGVVTTGSYANPSWITSLAETKVLPSQTGNSGKYLTTNGTSTSWATVTGVGASALDDLTDVVLTSPTTGQVLKYNGTNWINDTDSTGSGSFTYPSAGIAVSTGTAWATSLTDNSSNWNTAFTERLRWDGGSTGLTASTGRTSLGATTVGSNLFTLANPSAITFPRFNSDNTVSSLSASDFRTAIGAGTSSTTGTVTSITAGTGLSGGTITSSGTIAIDSTVATLTGTQTLTNKTINGSSNTISNVSLSSSVTGTLPIANGGTGQTTAAAAFDALSPMTTVGDIIYEGTGPAATRLGIGTTGQVLTVVGGIPAWATGGGGSMVYPGAGIPNSTGTAWGTSYSVTGTGNVVLSTRPTMSVTGSGLTLQDATDNTKQANFDLAGITTATTRNYTLPNVTGTLATLGNIAQTFTAAVTISGSLTASSTLSLTGAGGSAQSIATAQTTGTLDIGGTSGTGTISLGRSTVSQITNIQAGATASGSTKTVNIGTGGLTGSTTAITIGSTAGTSTTTLNSRTIFGGAIDETVFAVVDAAGVALSPANGTIQTWTLGASRTPTLGTWNEGEFITLMINDGTAFTITWTTMGIVWVGGTAPTLATTGFTIIELWRVGSTYYGALVGSVA